MSSTILPGIDKIWLSTRDFDIANGQTMGFMKITKQGQDESTLPYLFKDRKGDAYSGSQALYKGQTLDFTVAVNHLGLSLQYNPSKIIHPFNLLSDMDEIKRIDKQINYELKDVGIFFNSLTTNPTRIDFAKQDFMPRSIDNYFPVFNFLEGKRMRGQAYDTGFTFENKRHEFCFYSKGHELGSCDLLDLMRAENRLKKPDVISKSLGYNRFSDFLDSDAVEWNAHYVKYLNEKIFRNERQGVIFDFDNEVEKLKMFKSMGRNAMNHYLITTSLDNILQSFGNLKFLWKIMDEAGFSRQAINKEKIKIRELLQMTRKNKVLSIGSLIEELRQKFAA